MMSSIKVIAQVHKVNISSSFRFHAHIPPYLFGAYFFFCFFFYFSIYYSVNISSAMFASDLYREESIFFKYCLFYFF